MSLFFKIKFLNSAGGVDKTMWLIHVWIFKSVDHTATICMPVMWGV